MNKTFVAVVVGALLVSGCAVGSKQWYRADLSAKVADEAPVSIQLKPVAYWIETFGGVKTGEASDALAFTLSNKLQQPITIEWDRCAFVDEKGVSHRVIHSGVRLMSRDQPQVPSVVGPGGRIEDLVLPVDTVAFVDGRWVQTVYLPTQEGTTAKYTVILAVTIDSKTQQFTVPVELTGVTKTK